MSELHQDAMDVLRETSRTFFIPISRLPSGLKEAGCILISLYEGNRRNRGSSSTPG